MCYVFVHPRLHSLWLLLSGQVAPGQKWMHLLTPPNTKGWCEDIGWIPQVSLHSSIPIWLQMLSKWAESHVRACIGPRKWPIYNFCIFVFEFNMTIIMWVKFIDNPKINKQIQIFVQLLSRKVKGFYFKKWFIAKFLREEQLVKRFEDKFV